MNDTTQTHRLIDKIVHAAQCGWGPDELLHVLGPKAHPVIYRAAPRIPALITSPALRHAWLMLAPPPHPYYPLELLSSFSATISGLPVLRDSQVLDLPVDPDSKQARIRHKIEALLRKAESTTFEQEAEALISRAQQMRQDYRLTAPIPGTGDGRDAKEPIVSHRVLIKGPYIKHKATLLGAICQANGVSCLLLHSLGIASIIGLSEDLNHVEDLFDSLIRQCLYYLKHSPGAEVARKGQQTAAYRRSFFLAYAERIGQLLYQANHQSTPQDGSGAQLVLARRLDLAEQARDQIFPHLSSMSLSANHGHGLADGHKAAESSHFSGDSSGLAPVCPALSA